MADERKYYVFCEDKCLFEALTKEQIINAIAEATGVIPESIDVDAAFITKIKEQNSGDAVKIWVGSEDLFNAIQIKDPDTLYIYTTDFEEEVLSEIQKIKDGTTVVPAAESAALVSTVWCPLIVPPYNITQKGVYVVVFTLESDITFTMYTALLNIPVLGLPAKTLGVNNKWITYNPTTHKIEADSGLLISGVNLLDLAMETAQSPINT